MGEVMQLRHAANLIQTDANVVHATTSSQQNRAVEEHKRLFNRQSICPTFYSIYN